MSPRKNPSFSEATTPTRRSNRLSRRRSVGENYADLHNCIKFQHDPGTRAETGNTKQGEEPDEDVPMLDEPDDPVALQKGNTSTDRFNNQSITVCDSAVETMSPKGSSPSSSNAQKGNATLSPPGTPDKPMKNGHDGDIELSTSGNIYELLKGHNSEVGKSTGNKDSGPEEFPDIPIFKKRRAHAERGRSGTPRKSRSKWNDPNEMLTNPRSPLVNAKLRDLLLCDSKAWDILTPKEKEKVLAKFPDDREILDPGTEQARPDVEALLNNNNFRHDVARYQEDLRQGFHDPAWIEQAQMAHRAREAGAYDEELATAFRDSWDMPMPGQQQQEQQEQQQPQAGSENIDQDGDGAGDKDGDEDQDLQMNGHSPQMTGDGPAEKEGQSRFREETQNDDQVVVMEIA